ncbi:MAG TPA: GTP cyclohydrolase I FolE [Cyanobacteria bacterium UBA8530]|nr:GTP cyclohydrolase I FolE [Cyanobacteria bacterium UBA8530]
MVDQEKIRQAVRMILEAIGEDPDREGLLQTPDRVARMYGEIFGGLHQDPRGQIEVFFNEPHDEMVLVKDIPFYSMCEHHLVPFFGHVHVAYIPTNGRITGLSKLARVVEAVSRRPQLQERMTTTIADTLIDALSPQGVGVIVDAEHLCMSMRGVQKPGSRTVTSAMRGVFRTSAKTREEFLSLARSH